MGMVALGNAGGGGQTTFYCHLFAKKKCVCGRGGGGITLSHPGIPYSAKEGGGGGK